MTGPRAASWSRWRVRGALAAIVAAFVVVTSWNAGLAGYPLFYGSAARAMATSWRAFWSGAFDPAATITLDKLSGFLVPVALSIRTFGPHPWALGLPELVEGAVTIVACYLIGRRWRGPAVGLAAAAAAAVTPLLASLFAYPIEDALLTMSLACAFAAWQHAVLSRRTWPLLVAGLWVGIGFQAKMAQAWLILPALVIGYLVAVRSPGRWRRLAAFGAVTLVASLAWMAVFQLVPSGHRPWADGSSDDDVFTMVFGYNGVNRVLPGAVSAAVGAAASSSGGASAVAWTSQLRDGAFKLVGPDAVSQVGWLYPVAAAGLAAGVLRARRSRRRGQPDRSDLGTLVALGGWAATAAGLLSLATVPHTAYLSAVAVPLAVLAGQGIVAAVRALAAADRRTRLLGGGVLVVQTLWSVATIARYGPVPGWLMPVALVGLLVALAAGGLALVGPARARPVVGALAVVAVLAAPAAWTVLVLDPHDDGGSGDSYAGPPHTGQEGTGTSAHPTVFTPSAPWQRTADPRADATLRGALWYAQQHRLAGASSTLLTDSWTTAALLIESSGADVSSLGGYSGTVPNVTPAGLRTAIARHQVPFVLVGAVGSLAPKQPSALVHAVDVVVEHSCRQVPFNRYGYQHDPVTLYDCRAG